MKKILVLVAAVLGVAGWWWLRRQEQMAVDEARLWAAANEAAAEAQARRSAH